MERSSGVIELCMYGVLKELFHEVEAEIPKALP
ncbi:Uncharacterised protein [Helicobacter cinaedi]|uniref:Uncharacterized protein n=1 Tax=Helicobacter cinaedi TaxID=213 RepID=A0A377JX23_9HELI|nr:Uncharacterised protein [Helicobacter cinaedi]